MKATIRVTPTHSVSIALTNGQTIIGAMTGEGRTQTGVQVWTNTTNLTDPQAKEALLIAYGLTSDAEIEWDSILDQLTPAIS